MYQKELVYVCISDAGVVGSSLGLDIVTLDLSLNLSQLIDYLIGRADVATHFMRRSVQSQTGRRTTDIFGCLANEGWRRNC